MKFFFLQVNNAGIAGATVDWEAMKTLKLEDGKVCSYMLLKTHYQEVQPHVKVYQQYIEMDNFVDSFLKEQSQMASITEYCFVDAE